MHTLTAIADYFVSHPIIAGLKYTATAIAGGFIFFLISLFSGRLEVSVIFNGLFMLTIIAVAALSRFGIYRIIRNMTGFYTKGLVLIGVVELAYFGWMLFIAWDVAHPLYSDGAFTMMAMLAHVLFVPLGVLALIVAGIIWTVRAVIDRTHTARVTRAWRNSNANPDARSAY